MASSSAESLIRQATSHLINRDAKLSQRIGWILIATILVEAWDLYSLSFILVYLEAQYHPSALLLGITAAGTQVGSFIGALGAGWISDRIGRKTVLKWTMLLFIGLGLIQAFAPNMEALCAIRLLLGLPLGADVAIGYAYIMDAMPRGKRDVMGSRWQFMFAAGEILSIGVVLIFIGAGVHGALIWRVVLGLSAVPALILYLLRRRIPESTLWYVQTGRFREAKADSLRSYGDPLDFLPDTNVVIEKPTFREYFRDSFDTKVKGRATIFGWLSCFAQTVEFQSFGFYLPVILVAFGMKDLLQVNLATMGIYAIAAVSGLVAPQMLSKIGHRGVSISGFALVALSLWVAAWALHANVLAALLISSCTLLWGHYWAGSNSMTIASMIPAARYRGTASGFSYAFFVKVPAALAAVFVPVITAAIGQSWMTLLVSAVPLVTFLGAAFVLPEIYSYDAVEVDGARTPSIAR